MPTGSMCRLGRHRHGHESMKGAEHVEGAGERHGSMAVEGSATRRSEVAEAARCIPTAGTHLRNSAGTTLAHGLQT